MSSLRARSLATWLVWLLLIISCSGDPGSTPVADSADRGASDRLSMSSVGVPAGARLRLALPRPATYRPDEVSLTDQGAVILADLLYDGLTEADGGSGELRPGLAERWSANQDFTIWTFELDPDAGVPGSAAARTLRVLSAEGGGSGAAAFTAGMSRVRAPDPLTVAIELMAPNAGFPWLLSGLPYSIVGSDGGTTGDYEIASDDANGMVLRRVRPPEGPSPGDEPPEIVVTWLEPSDGDDLATLASGTVDAALNTDGSDVPDDLIETARALVATRFYVFDRRSTGLASVERRREVVARLDPRALPTTADGGSAVINGLVPFGVPGHRSAVSPRSGDEPDPGGTVRHEVGEELVVSFSGSSQEPVARAIADQLSDGGVDAVAEEVAANDLARLIVSGGADVFSFGWVAPAGSADAIIPPLLAGASPANVAHFDSPAIDDLLTRAAVTVDDHARWDLLAEAERLALDEATIVPVVSARSRLVVTPAWQGLVVRADGSIDLQATG